MGFWSGPHACVGHMLVDYVREAKELLPYSIFIITGHCKRVKIHVMVEELLPNKKYSVLIKDAHTLREKFLLV